MITIFSTSRCSACAAAKKYMKENNIPFIERNIEDDDAAYEMLKERDIRSVPVIYLDDDNYCVGFKKEKIDEFSQK